MNIGNKDFAREMLKEFGADRFYHAMFRNGNPDHAKSVHEALGGDDNGWFSLRRELRLTPVEGERLTDFGPADDQAIRESLCRAAFNIASQYKNFALKSPFLPGSIHARMILDQQNEWTKRYADFLAKFKEEMG